MVIDALRRQAMRRGIQMVPDVLTIRLLVEENQIRGACAGILPGEKSR